MHEQKYSQRYFCSEIAAASVERPQQLSTLLGRTRPNPQRQVVQLPVVRLPRAARNGRRRAACGPSEPASSTYLNTASARESME
jgi:hypothetical protein